MVLGLRARRFTVDFLCKPFDSCIEPWQTEFWFGHIWWNEPFNGLYKACFKFDPHVIHWHWHVTMVCVLKLGLVVFKAGHIRAIIDIDLLIGGILLTLLTGGGALVKDRSRVLSLRVGISTTWNRQCSLALIMSKSRIFAPHRALSCCQTLYHHGWNHLHPKHEHFCLT